jgi:hypothetical protein
MRCTSQNDTTLGQIIRSYSPDSAPAFSTQSAENVFLTKLHIIHSDPLPHSPDFLLFPKFKHYLKGCFEPIEGIKRIPVALKGISEYDLNLHTVMAVPVVYLKGN